MPSTTHEYLQSLAPIRGSAIVVSTMTPAKVWPLMDRHELDFEYLPSAMGHASDIALGLALAQPERRVICLNGDGSLVMNLGTLITARDCGVENLTMLVFLNGRYELGGGSRVPGATSTDWVGLAKAAGWRRAAHFHGVAPFQAAVAGLVQSDGLTFVALEVFDPPHLEMSLPAHHPAESIRKLRAALS